MEIDAETKEIEKMNWMDLKLRDGFNSNTYTVVFPYIQLYNGCISLCPAYDVKLHPPAAL